MNSAMPTVTGVDTHAHVFRHDLPMVKERRYSPDYDASVEQYVSLLRHSGFSHGVLVQPSFLGTDNTYLVEALVTYPAMLRGIAVVDPEISVAELDKLGESGVMGIRLNLVGKGLEDYGDSGWQSLFQELASRGWSVQIQRSMDSVAQVVEAIVPSGVDVVVDHLGLPLGAFDPSNKACGALLELLGQSNVWMKLSATYRSGMGRQSAREALDILRDAMHGPDRWLWGSDWPHTRFESQTSHRQQVDFLNELVPDTEERCRVLIDNPSTLFALR